MCTAAVVPIGGVAWADPQSDATKGVQEFLDVGRTAVPRAQCGPNSLPEAGLQGDVPAEDRMSGRSQQGYRCNVSLVGSYPGKGGGITSVTFDHCSYTGSFFPGNLIGNSSGVQVLDISDPADPKPTATLTEPAMLGGTWESLKVNVKRKLLAATAVPVGVGAAYFSIYDISDCAHPRLLNPGAGTNLGMPLPIMSHEGGFSPDGNTYWASGVTGGLLSAIDVSNPADPKVVWQALTGLTSHGFGLTPDGNRLYLSVLAGFTVLDVSAVQRRDPNPQVPHIGRVFWSDGQATQHAIPVTYDGKPFVFAVDEGGSGGVKLMDMSDESAPTVSSKIKLEINLPQNMGKNLGSSMGGSLFAYEAHYCAADRPVNPTALACSWVSSGIRVFDVRDPDDIREIAYYNPPALKGQNLQLTNSPHALASIIGVPVLSTVPIARAVLEGQFNPQDAQTSRASQTGFGDLSSDWCFSPPEWRGSQLWTTCADNGFMTLQLENDVYTPPVDQASTIGQS
ncbi:hypothetical protein R4P64_29530 [Rhodococcus sp. IEGM 1366]|nr:hypothetical protein [Rhodococcus sp. IEGM 1366]MDV8070678.1 hypothetical protein [Rhodococcus sp. IEGM 1366]